MGWDVVPARSNGLESEQVKEREQEDPDKVDEVPVEPGVLDHPGPLPVEPVGEEDREHQKTDRNVDGMEAGVKAAA